MKQQTCILLFIATRLRLLLLQVVQLENRCNRVGRVCDSRHCFIGCPPHLDGVRVEWVALQQLHIVLTDPHKEQHLLAQQRDYRCIDAYGEKGRNDTRNRLHVGCGMLRNELSEDTTKPRCKAKQLVASKDLQRMLRIDALLLSILDYLIEQWADVVHFGELCPALLQ